MSFAELMSGMQGALEEEIEAVRVADAARERPVHSGQSLGRVADGWLYQFSLDQVLDVYEETPVELHFGRSADIAHTYGGVVVACVVTELTIMCALELREDLSLATVRFNTAFLLESLLERLKELPESKCALSLTAFGQFQPTVDTGDEVDRLDIPEANQFQVEAVGLAVTRNVSYIWGPPGTGKTVTLAFVARAMVERGLRVLIAASTNIAVDNGILRCAGLPTAQGLIVRLGTPQLSRLRPSLSGTRNRKSTRWTEAVPGTGIHVLPGRPVMDEDDELLRKRILREARIVGATLSRVSLAHELQTPGFDALLLDEGSTASLPCVFLAATLARRKVVILGDPKQLPPIALSSGQLAKRWLARDVFNEAGLRDRDDRAVMLREQYRMHPRIAGLANTLVYGGRLVDAPAISGLSRHDAPVHLIDTSAELAECVRVNGSKENPVHARLAVAAARAALHASQTSEEWLEEFVQRAESAGHETSELLPVLDEISHELTDRGIPDVYKVLNLRALVQRDGVPDDLGARLRQVRLTTGLALPLLPTPKPVAIITPYRAQYRLIQRLVRQDKLDSHVDVGTVHRFQGLERDIVIFDTVESGPEDPGWFLGRGWGSESMRLVNVAITRARSHLVVVANVQHLRRTLRREATLRQLVDLLVASEAEGMR